MLFVCHKIFKSYKIFKNYKIFKSYNIFPANTKYWNKNIRGNFNYYCLKLKYLFERGIIIIIIIFLLMLFCTAESRKLVPNELSYTHHHNCTLVLS